MMRHITCSFVALLIASLVTGAHAQETTGTILGTVTDSSGAVLPGVTVSLKHAETSQERTVVTDGQGRYRVPSLLVGHYEVTAQLEGFQTLVRSGIEITIAREALVNLSMSIGEISEQVTVSGDAPLVETTTSAVSNVVGHHQLQTLPLNGRSFEQLALLQPNVTTMPFVSGSITLGNTKEVLIAGSRWYTTLYLLDGTEMNEGRNSGSASGNILGVESVQEFRVLTQNFNAEYGRASGGIVSAITRSGTNRFSGAAYEFLRSDALDARNYFDLDDPPPFSRNQFGVAAGGPIVRDRTFYFANYEGLRQQLTGTNVAVVPAPHVHEGFLLDSRGQPVPVPFTPTAKEFLDTFYPLPNAGLLTGTDGGRLVTNPDTKVRDDYVTGKVDQVLSGSHKAFVRYTFDDSSVTSQLTIPIGENHGTITKNLLTVEDSYILSSSLLNTFRFGMNRDQARDVMVDLIQVPDYMRFVPDTHLGNLRIPGFTTVGEDGSLPRYVLNLMLEFSDDVSLSAGSHMLKAGFTVKRYRSDTQFARRNNGRYDFTSIANFMRGAAQRFEAPMPSTDTERRWLQWLFGAYVQDDIALGSRLRLNAGVRYEPYTIPDELDGKLSNLLNRLGSEFVVGEFFHENPSLKNWQPRIGMAWDLFGDGRTSIRSAWGIFQNPILPSAYSLDGTRIPPYFQSATLSNPPFPNAYDVYLNTPGVLAQSRDVTSYPERIRTPTYHKWHVTFDREIAPSMRLSVSYSGNRGYNLLRQKEANTARPVTLPSGESFFPPGPQRRNPNFSSILAIDYDVESSYHGGSVTLERRLQDGLQFQVAYTLSKHIDQGSGTLGAVILTQGAGSGLVSSDPDNLERDRGLSAWDRRHNFVANAMYELPFGEGRQVPLGGVADYVLGGWNVNAIVTLASGVPLNVVIGRFDNLRNLDSRTPSRPSLAAGASSNPIVGDGRDPNRYFDPTAFTLPPAGFYGNLARNTLISPGVATVDLALTKQVRIPAFSEQFGLEFRLETFNLLNRANFGQPGREIFAPDGSYLPNAGVISDTTTPSRQIQLGIKATW